MQRPLRSELSVMFGEIVDGKWADESHHMVLVDFPDRLKPLGVVRVYCNRAMAVPLRQALDNIVERGCIHQITSFDGCFNIRKQRGDLLRLSVHAWGMAVDFNAGENELGSAGNMTKEFIACFEDVGFEWGGRWHRPDPQHFQYVTED